MVSGEQGRGPGVGKAPSQRCMSDLVVNIGDSQVTQEHKIEAMEDRDEQ